MEIKRDQPKIFGIGLNKTGTTTLGVCGTHLGLRCSSCDASLLEDYVLRKNFTRIKQKVKEFDLFEDWPWPLIYEELDQLYPGSKFILTVRKSDLVWLESLKKHSMRTKPLSHCRKLAYGYNFPHKKEQEHLDFYNRHNERVRAYFKGRSSDFLELCWEKGDGFEELCSFLNFEVPDMPLPHANKAADNRIRKSRVVMNRLLRFVNY